MAAERLTPAAIAAELDFLDGQAKVVAGDVVVSIGFTNAAVKDLAPREHEELAAWLFAMIQREPVRSSPAYTGHRIVLGALATELRGFAQAAGEPVGLLADLRAASIQADERRIQARVADQAAAFDRHIDDVLLANAFQHEADQAAHGEDPPGDAPTAVPPRGDDDGPIWAL